VAGDARLAQSADAPVNVGYGVPRLPDQDPHVVALLLDVGSDSMPAAECLASSPESVPIALSNILLAMKAAPSMILNQLVWFHFAANAPARINLAMSRKTHRASARTGHLERTRQTPGPTGLSRSRQPKARCRR
jgi:hypothetical protein